MKIAGLREGAPGLKIEGQLERGLILNARFV
jgi:hypothetical protein